MPYNWRDMTAEQRSEALQARHRAGQPWHGPPHRIERHWYHLSGSCYEHAPILGHSPERMAEFERSLLSTLAEPCEQVCVWCVLPTHYHVMVQCRSIPLCRRAIGKLHGRLSHGWNVEDGAAGRTCWHRCLLKEIKTEAHRWATVNHIHHNPVRHGYAKLWQDWPFSSATQYLSTVPRDEVERIWREFPILDMGAGWDREDS